MKKLIKKRICSYAPNIGTGATVYAYETQAALQDNTRVEQLTPQQVQQLLDEQAKYEAHQEAVKDIAATTVLAGAAGAAVGGKLGGQAGAVAGGAGAAAVTAVVETYNTCTSCHDND